MLLVPRSWVLRYFKTYQCYVALQTQKYQKAFNLLQESLGYYKMQVNRRAIADIKLIQQHYPQVLAYLKKALATLPLLWTGTAVKF
ncbi:MAG TPA: hypothetical protein EYQ57_06480 [Methylococcaceae bacterium]|nr:hypothetical protein [Methylococcaceae bacterium]